MRQLLAALLLLILAAPAEAQAVDLNLVLAVDVSGSVNATRYELQRNGYAAAFRDPLVLQAIAAGTHQAIAVAMVQWTGPLPPHSIENVGTREILLITTELKEPPAVR